jgi:hypothetical protein
MDDDETITPPPEPKPERTRLLSMNLPLHTCH